MWVLVLLFGTIHIRDSDILNVTDPIQADCTQTDHTLTDNTLTVCTQTAQIQTTHRTLTCLFGNIEPVLVRLRKLRLSLLDAGSTQSSSKELRESEAMAVIVCRSDDENLQSASSRDDRHASGS